MSRPFAWLIAATAAVLIVADFIRIDSASHSVSDTLINWVPQTAVIAFVATVLANLVSRLPIRRS